MGRSSASVKDLERDFARKLVWSRQPHNRKNTFDILAVDGSTKGNPRSKHKDVHAQPTVPKSIFDVEDEISSKND